MHIPENWCDLHLSEVGITAPTSASYDDSVTFAQICPITWKYICSNATSINTPICQQKPPTASPTTASPTTPYPTTPYPTTAYPTTASPTTASPTTLSPT